MKRFALLLVMAFIPIAYGDVITFDNLPAASGGAPIPTTYANLIWYGWGYTSAPFGNSGYATALTSSPSVAFNLGGGVPGALALIISPTPFFLLSGEFAAAFENGLTLNVTAMLFGDQVGTASFNLDETTRLLQTFEFGPVTELDFSVTAGTPAPGVGGSGPYFGLDNLTISTPEPTTLPLILLGSVALVALRRRVGPRFYICEAIAKVSWRPAATRESGPSFPAWYRGTRGGSPPHRRQSARVR